MRHKAPLVAALLALALPSWSAAHAHAPGRRSPARPSSLTADPGFDLSGFESVFFMKALPGGKYLTAARGKPQAVGSQTSSGSLFFRVTDRVKPVLAQQYGEASIGPALDEPAKLRPVDATVDAAGGLFVGYVLDTLAGRQNLRIAKYLPVQGQQPVVTAVFDVLCRDQAKGRSIVADGAGGVFVRGFTWDASNDQQLSVPYTRRFSSTGALLWDERGAAAHQMATSPSETTPAMLLGVADGNGGLFEVLNTKGVTAQNNFAPQSDRARIVHRKADGSVAYDRVISLPSTSKARGTAPTPGAITGIFLGSDGRPIVVFRKNGDDAHRRLLHIAADGKARQVASFSDDDVVMQAGDGSVVVMAIRGGATAQYTFTRYGVVGGAVAEVEVRRTPELQIEKSVWPETASQVSISPNGVVVIASNHKVAGRPSIAALTIDGRFLGSAMSPGGADMVLNDGARWFGYDLADDGATWSYEGGAIDLGSAGVGALPGLVVQ